MSRCLFLETPSLPRARRAYQAILEEPAEAATDEASALSEPVLAEDWNKPEEDQAWSHLQRVRWSLCLFSSVILPERSSDQRLFRYMPVGVIEVVSNPSKIGPSQDSERLGRG